MFINFETVLVLESIGVDYFSHNKEGFQNMSDSKYHRLYNIWLPFTGSQGADVCCDIVHIGKKLEGNASRLRIAVYEVANRMDTVVLFQVHQVEEALATFLAMAGQGELVCVE